MIPTKMERQTTSTGNSLEQNEQINVLLILYNNNTGDA
jgi:hypothetical protein